MDIYKLSPHIRHAKKHIGSFKTKRQVSVCYDARLFYFENVSGYITADTIKYNISNKCAVYLPPLTRYTFKLVRSKDSEISVFDFDLVTDYSNIRSSLGTATVTDFDRSKVNSYELPSGFSSPIVICSSKLSSFLDDCVSSFCSKSDAYLDRSSAYLKLALLELVDSTEVVYSELCKRITDYVAYHLSDPQMTNESIAAELNYHPYYINRIVKRELGVSLRTYIIAARIDSAKKLLLTSDANISEISMLSGFSSTSYFAKIFREREGVTPREYRSINRYIQL